MHPTRHLLLTTCLLASACTGGEPSDKGVVLDTGDPGSDDTGEAPTGPSLTGAVLVPEDTTRDGALTAGLVRVVFGDGPLVFETLAHAPVDEAGAFALSWEEDAGASVAASPGNDQPELLAAFYLPLVYEDADGDGAWTAGEVVIGAGLERFVAWLGGTVPEGWPAGWSTVDLGMSGQYKPNRCLMDSSLVMTAREDEDYPVFTELSEGVEVRLRGLPAVLSLGGEMSDLGAEHERFLAISYQAIAEGPLADYPPVFDVAAGNGPFEVALSEAPPEAEVWSNDASWRYSVHVPLLYADLDGSGAWTAEADQLTAASTCTDGVWAYARHTWPVVDYRGLRLLDCYQGQVGWRMAYTDPDSGSSTYLDSAGSLDLVVDPGSCSL